MDRKVFTDEEDERLPLQGIQILKARWRMFHKDSTDLEAARSVYLRGVNEYMTQQNALDKEYNSQNE